MSLVKFLNDDLKEIQRAIDDVKSKSSYTENSDFAKFVDDVEAHTSYWLQHHKKFKL
jgi:hypothetical protein